MIRCVTYAYLFFARMRRFLLTSDTIDSIYFVLKFEWTNHKLSIVSEVKKKKKINASELKISICHNPNHDIIE